MSIEDNKRLVRAFNSHFAHSDIDRILDLMTDDCTWWINGKPDLFPVTGTKSKAQFGDILRGVHASIEGGMPMEVIGLVAEGDQVAAELRARATTKTGRSYDNRYLMLYTVRDGKVSDVREYTDLMTIADVFYAPESSSADGGAPIRPSPVEGPVIAPVAGETPCPQAAKAVVAEFLGHFRTADVHALTQMMTEDAVWWTNGRTDLWAGAGSRTRSEIADTWRGLFSRLDGGLDMAVLSMVAEGFEVAAQARARATTRTGQVYDNGYHFLVTVRDGKVAAVKDYTDLLHAAVVFS